MADPARPLRADARRKREAIVEAAKDVLAEWGADVPLDHVAKRAGVGIATLYRHFPTREELIAGVYLSEIDPLCDTLDDLLAAMPADRALTTWMRRFVRHVGSKPCMPLAVKSIIAPDGPAVVRPAHDRLLTTVTHLVRTGERAGVFREGVVPEDLLMAMTGFCLASDRTDLPDQGDRVVLMLVDGMRPREV